MILRRKRTRDEPKPNVAKARAELERVKKQRPDVERLVAALTNEKHLNDFTANVIVTFKGGRP